MNDAAAASARFLVLAPEFPPDRGGVQTYSWEVAMELHRRGHPLAALTPITSAPDISDVRAPFPILPLLRLRRRHDAATVQHYLQIFPGQPAVNRLKPVPPKASQTIVLATNAIHAALAADLQPTGTPLWVCIHGNDFTQEYIPIGHPDLRTRLGVKRGHRLDYRIGRWCTSRLLRRAFPKVTRIFANSHYTARRFTEKHPKAADMVRVTGIGLADHWLTEAAIPPRPKTSDGKTRLLTVCRLAEDNKNVAGVIRALGLLRNRSNNTMSPSAPNSGNPNLDQVVYDIVGDGPLKTSLQALAESCGVHDIVRFHGFVSTEALHEKYGKADLFVMTPYESPLSFEGFGIVYLEANSYGLPVLATRIGGISDAVDGNRSGWFAESPQPEHIAAEISAFLQGRVGIDPETCKAHARKHTWAAVVTCMLE